VVVEDSYFINKTGHFSSYTMPDTDNFEVKNFRFFFSLNKKLIFTPETNIIYKMDDGPARILIINQI
jgi:hypothetical protein